MVRYWILRQKTPFSPIQEGIVVEIKKRKDQSSQAHHTHSGRAQQAEIIYPKNNGRSKERRVWHASKIRGEIRQQSDTYILLSNESMKTSTTRTGPPRQSLSTDGERSPNETCPAIGIVYTQNVQGLTGEYKGLESLVDPIVDLMIRHNIMV